MMIEAWRVCVSRDEVISSDGGERVVMATVMVATAALAEL